MNCEFDIDRTGCPSFEIAAYIDGELDEARAAEIETHFSDCTACAEELNHQKQFLRTLDSGLRRDGEIDLPKDFTQQIVANAESSVAGLRSSSERFNAVFIIAALSLFVMFALGADSQGLVNAGLRVLDQAAAVGGFIGRLVYSFLVGVVVIMRSSAAVAGEMSSAPLMGLVFSVAAVVVVSRTLLRLRRF